MRQLVRGPLPQSAVTRAHALHRERRSPCLERAHAHTHHLRAEERGIVLEGGGFAPRRCPACAVGVVCAEASRARWGVGERHRARWPPMDLEPQPPLRENECEGGGGAVRSAARSRPQTHRSHFRAIERRFARDERPHGQSGALARSGCSRQGARGRRTEHRTRGWRAVMVESLPWRYSALFILPHLSKHDRSAVAHHTISMSIPTYSLLYTYRRLYYLIGVKRSATSDASFFSSFSSPLLPLLLLLRFLARLPVLPRTQHHQP
jgi:hypothetical protein